MTMAPEDHTQQIPQGGYYSQSAAPRAAGSADAAAG